MKSPLSTYNDYLDKNLIKVDDQQKLAIQEIDSFLSQSLNKSSSIYLSLKKKKKIAQRRLSLWGGRCRENHVNGYLL